jgi:hypothetical protein
MTKAISLLFAVALAGAALLFAAALAQSGGDAEKAARRLCAERLCGVVFF